MLILHEILDNDARHIADLISDVYKIPAELHKEDLSSWFKPLKKFNGYWYSPEIISKKIKKEVPDKAVIILTDRDLYYGNKSADDEWIFGYCHEDKHFQVLSNARMKGKDSRPGHELLVSYNTYMKRFDNMVIHEIGHDVIQRQHMKNAYWVNASTGIKYPLGPHCTDNKCVMYEVVEIITPPASSGYMLLGREKKFDAGLDDHIQRVYDDWFCDTCKKSMKISEEYRNK